jgi:hypothetical protein
MFSGNNGDRLQLLGKVERGEPAGHGALTR